MRPSSYTPMPYHVRWLHQDYDAMNKMSVEQNKKALSYRTEKLKLHLVISTVTVKIHRKATVTAPP